MRFALAFMAVLLTDAHHKVNTVCACACCCCADCLLNDGRLEVDQSALTGESLPVTMYKGDSCKMGSTAVRGEVEATVEVCFHVLRTSCAEVMRSLCCLGAPWAWTAAPMRCLLVCQAALHVSGAVWGAGDDALLLPVLGLLL
jgi:hypothetical protein